jgi:hypothetical protein
LNQPTKKAVSLSLKTARSIPLLYGLLTVVACDSSGSKTDRWDWDANNDPNGIQNGSSNKASQQYVTATGLSLRIAPNTGATRTNVLPSGTRILVEQTTSPLVVDGQIGHWYRAVEFDGYVAGHFIAPEKGTETSPYVLSKLDWYWEGYEVSRLILHAGKAKLFDYQESGGGTSLTERNGSYHVLPNGIKITLDPGQMWSGWNRAAFGASDCWPISNHIPSSCKPGTPTTKAGLVINLRYCHELGGFVTGNCDGPGGDARVYRKKNKETNVRGFPRSECSWVQSQAVDGDEFDVYTGWWCPPHSNK